MGIEGIRAIRERAGLEGDFEVSELDLVYAHKMQELTGEQVEMPSPAMCTLVDLCTETGDDVLPLDMNDTAFTELYCDTVNAWDFVKEHRLAKKGMKRRFSSSTAREFALEWDDYINGVKGYREVSEKREAYIANRIRDISNVRGSLLAVIEVERAQAVADLLR